MIEVESGVATNGALSARKAILESAERLFAEHGLFAISNRRVSRAAGQGNNAAVAYHFGAKFDLVRAIMERHHAHMEAGRARLLAEYDGSLEVRHWVSCLVRPVTDYLGTLERPTGYARLCAQVVSDPGMRDIWCAVAVSSPTMMRIRDGIYACVPGLPPAVRRVRHDMGLHLVVQVCALYELALSGASATTYASWDDCGTGIIDAIVGIWEAPTRS